MLSLRTNSSAAWLRVALDNLDAVLVDHAHCEHKAAITALSFVGRYPDDPYLVEKLSALAAEEADHLHRVAAICHKRGLSLGHPQEDRYVKKLLKLTSDDERQHRVDRLLICAIIEARSCERLQLLAENLENPELRAFYDELWRCEAGHHALFVELARRISPTPQTVQARLETLCAAEALILEALPVEPRVH